MELPIVEGAGVSVASADVELQLKLGPGRALLDEILLRKIAADLAGQRGVNLSDGELDEALASLYADLGLFEPAQIAGWLAEAKVEEAVLRQYMREWLLKERLAPVMIPDALVRQRFLSSPYDYAVLHVQKIIVPGSGPAAETLLQLNEGELTWEQAALRTGAMESLVLRRKETPAEAEAALFVAPLGGVVGPVEEAVGLYAIYRLAWKTEPTLDESLSAEIRAELYEEELRCALAARPAKFLR